ncbi:Uncharacterised protein [Mycobacteroides abscessus subsp. bolletii]|uniref:hypothetical protein n=1 Tax=Mycobacteroides abscessus TaxID=36809 RepID=UPI0009A7B04E|nr:hypothetical protein [Mycobacteroides abscessus]SKR94595.1 Uncharacterised protein [Mycobacteroides abscessus subsp. bolletii]SKS02836.1 Uncharacterised protein [Mycobacteroides abscessus subsp. bolletii]DAZ90177.1 TPA_asm: hypothetical protein PROPHIFVLQ01-1_91 [Mycobacterium phage prophiFVLQ01-1]
MSALTKRQARDIEASLYDQKCDVMAGILKPDEFVKRCRAARDRGVQLRDNVVSFARSIDATF